MGLFGIEAYNGGTHAFRNHPACEYVEHCALSVPSGSGICDISRLARGGIITKKRILMPEDLSEMLRSGARRLIES